MNIKYRLKALHITVLKVVIHLSALIPIFIIYWQAFSDDLGADPVEAILHFTGIGAFNLLLLSLLVSPLAKILRQGILVNVRRLLGLYTFFYAFCHFTSYIVFELQLEWGLLLSEIIKRPYITVGFVALLVLTSLTVTSNRAAQRKLGTKWQKLHNWVYLASLLVALHYIWSVKSDLVQPIIYWLLLITLLTFRREKLLRKIKAFLRKRQQKGKNSKKELA
ncbi:MAG: sulfoxide reductase heme-binding subunit YedZ [Paraglaciecola sp.]|jgi:sulfoxide reductase heme-binding subunit YedZ